MNPHTRKLGDFGWLMEHVDRQGAVAALMVAYGPHVKGQPPDELEPWRRFWRRHSHRLHSIGPRKEVLLQEALRSSSVVRRAAHDWLWREQPDWARLVPLAASTEPWGDHDLTLASHAGPVLDLDVAPDAPIVISASQDGTARAWNLETGAQTAIVGQHEGWVTSVAWLQKDLCLTGGRDGTVVAWNPNGKGAGAHWDLGGWIGGLVSCGDGHRALALVDRQLMVLDAWRPGTVIRSQMPGYGRLQAVAINPQTSFAAVAGPGGVLIVDWSRGDVVRTLARHRAPVHGLAFGTRNELVSASGDGTIRISDVATGSIRAEVKSKSAVRSAAISPDGRTLAAGCLGKDGAAEIALWWLDTGKRQGILRGHVGEITAIGFTGDGGTLVTASHDRTLKTWPMGHLDERPNPTAPPSISADALLATDPSGVLAASVEPDTIGVWSLTTGRRLRQIRRPEPSRPRAAVLHPDGLRLFVAGFGHALEEWDLAAGRRTAVFEGHSHVVNDLALMPNGGAIASGSGDGTIRLWRLSDRKELLKLDQRSWIQTVDVDAAGRRLLAVGRINPSLWVWDLAPGTSVAAMDTGPGAVMEASLHPGGRHAVVSRRSGYGTEYEVLLYDLQRETSEGLRLDESNGPYRVGFTGEGEYAVTAGREGAVQLWTVPGRRCVADWTPDQPIDDLSVGGDVAAVLHAPELTFLAVGGRWSGPAGARVVFSARPVATVWHPARPLLATALESGVIVVHEWHPESSHAEEVLRHAVAPTTPSAVRWSGDGRRVGSRLPDGTEDWVDLAGRRTEPPAEQVAPQRSHDGEWSARCVGPAVILTPRRPPT